MKIINEKGKLFGIINIVDLLVLLAVLAVVGGVVWKVLAPRVSEAAGQNATLTYIVRVRAVDARQQDRISKQIEKDPRLIAGNDYVAGAKVTEVSFVPYVQQNPTSTGAFFSATDPTRVDVLFTVQATVPKNTAIIKVGPQEIRMGTGHYLKTKYVENASIIEWVDLTDEPVNTNG